MSKKEEFPGFTEEFRSSIIDFTTDLKNTFPEYSDVLDKWTNRETSDSDIQDLFEYCLKTYPERFFDILNQNKSLFTEESTLNVEFLPGIDFKKLYNSNGVTDKIRETMWKYLQVILLILVNSLQSKINFGEAMDVFNKIDVGELQSQLTDAMKNISSFFEKMDVNDDKEPTNEPDEESTEETQETQDTNIPKLPKIEELKDHLQFLFDGKIGKLAKELADDMSSDFVEAFGGDLGDAKSTKDVLNAFMKNPQKMGNVVNTVKEKLADKMKSGDITKEDLVNEASEMMSKMQGMGDSLGGMEGLEGLAGMSGMGDMFKKMAKSMGVNIPKGARMNTNALNEMQKKSTAKERLKARAMAKKQAEVVKKLEEEVEKLKRQQEYEVFLKNNPEFNPDSPLFSLDEKQEKSAVRDPNVLSSAQKKRLKKKNRKEKIKEKKEEQTKIENKA